MLGGLNWILDSLYWDSTFVGDFRPSADLEYRARQSIDGAQSWLQILLALAGYLDGFHDSHTVFLPPPLTVTMRFGWSWRNIGGQTYITAVESKARDAGFAPGDRLVEVDRVPASPANMAAIWYAYQLLVPRRSVHVVVERPDGSRHAADIEASLGRRAARMDYGDVDNVRAILDQLANKLRAHHTWQDRDSVALWHFDVFGIRDRGLDSHAREANRYPWLILDLRGNAGGAIESLTRLLSHFSDETFEAFEEHWRDSTTTRTITPDEHPYQGHLIILVDRGTSSAAEVFSYVLQNRGRAQILGDTTAGAVREAIESDLSDNAGNQFYSFGLLVTVADLRMADGAELEGVGVVPDEVVLPSGADLAAGRDPVMQRALALAGIEVSGEEAARILH